MTTVAQQIFVYGGSGIAWALLGMLSLAIAYVAFARNSDGDGL